MPSIEELLERDSEAWKPEPGDSLTGTVMALGENDAGWGLYPILEIDDKNGKQWAWHAFATVAKNEIAKFGPKPGDEVGVKYVGKATSKAGTEYDKYIVKFLRADSDVPDAPNWDAIGKDAQEELAELEPTTVDADGKAF